MHHSSPGSGQKFARRSGRSLPCACRVSFGRPRRWGAGSPHWRVVGARAASGVEALVQAMDFEEGAGAYIGCAHDQVVLPGGNAFTQIRKLPYKKAPFPRVVNNRSCSTATHSSGMPRNTLAGVARVWASNLIVPDLGPNWPV